MPQPRGQLKDTPKLELANGTRLRIAGRAEEGEYHLRTRNAIANGMRSAKLFATRDKIINRQFSRATPKRQTEAYIRVLEGCPSTVRCGQDVMRVAPSLVNMCQVSFEFVQHP